MELPINKFLNEKDEKGGYKYPYAEKLKSYFLFNPDPILADMRKSNAFLHEMRWRLERAANHLKLYEEDPNSTYPELDNLGNKLVKTHYGGYVSETQTVYLVLAKLREHLSSTLLAKCDGDFFTLEMFEDFVKKTDVKVTEMGFELFPNKVTLIEPL